MPRRTRGALAAGAVAAGIAAAGFVAAPAHAEPASFGAAQVWAQPGTGTVMIMQGRVCRYVVNARSGLNVRKRPNGKKVGALKHGKVVFAKKCRKPYGWVRLRGNVKKRYLKKWVYRPYLSRF